MTIIQDMERDTTDEARVGQDHKNLNSKSSNRTPPSVTGGWTIDLFSFPSPPRRRRRAAAEWLLLTRENQIHKEKKKSYNRKKDIEQRYTVIQECCLKRKSTAGFPYTPSRLIHVTSHRRFHELLSRVSWPCSVRVAGFQVTLARKK
jgi:hypothetical protein